LAGKGCRSVATTLEKPSVELYDADLAGPGGVALWFGQEKHGLTQEAVDSALLRVFIPTVGMA